MSRPQIGLAQACVKWGLCSKNDADRALALCRQLEQLGREGDVLALLTDQGSITPAQAQAVYEGRQPSLDTPQVGMDEGTATVAFERGDLEALRDNVQDSVESLFDDEPDEPEDSESQESTALFDQSDFDAMRADAPDQTAAFAPPARPPAPRPGATVALSGDEREAVKERSASVPPDSPTATIARPGLDWMDQAGEGGADPTSTFNRLDLDSARANQTATFSGTKAFSPDDVQQARVRSTGESSGQGNSADASAQRAASHATFGKDLVGMVLGGCSIEREIGRGAWAVVFEATHLSLQRPIALKVLMPSTRGPQAAEQLIREARSLARIEHSNIVQVFDVGSEQGLSFIVMQLLPGDNLAQYLKQKGAIPWQEACKLALGIADGLTVAHNTGVVHRDIKPANVLLSKDNTPKIADFGLAAPFLEDDNPSDEVMGTPAYMSPEQIDGRQVDGRADIYSLGCTLYEMLTGRKPFTGRHALEVVLKQTTEHAVPVHKLMPEVPVSVSGVVRKCMAKQPDARYASATELADDLRNVLGGGKPRVVGEIEDVMSRMETLISQAPQPGSQYRPTAIFAAAAVLIGAVAMGLTLALPAFEEPTPDVTLPEQVQTARERSANEGWTALVQVENFARRYPQRADEIEPMYAEVERTYGDLLGQEVEESRQNTAGILDQARRQDLDSALAKVELARSRSALIDAARALDAYPVAFRVGAFFDEWNGALQAVYAKIRETTEMAYIPAVPNEGAREGEPSERPAFLMDLTEVSNAEWGRYVRETGARPPDHWDGEGVPRGSENLPVVGVSAREAQKYAEWVGKRLPTSEEWERAARGCRDRLYPWGNAIDPDVVAARGAATQSLMETNSLHDGRTEHGVFHMVGNAMEWTADESDDPLLGVGRIVRGGSVRSHVAQCTTRFVYTVPAETADPAMYIGFRCVKDVR